MPTLADVKHMRTAEVLIWKNDYIPGVVVCIWAHGVVVSHPLRMRKALGSHPSVSMLHISQQTKMQKIGV